MTIPFSITFIYLLLSLSTFGQTNNEYKFSYKFQLDQPKAESIISIDTIYHQENSSNVRGELQDIKSEPVIFSTITFKGSDTVITMITNQNGIFELKLKPGNYDMSIECFSYKSVFKKITIDKHHSLLLKATLAIEGLYEWYNIRSKIKLGEAELNKIKNCVQHSNGDLIKCWKKGIYTVSMEF